MRLVLARLFIHVEEPSMKVALCKIIGKLELDKYFDVAIIEHQGKPRLLKDLPNRLLGYKYRLKYEDIYILVLVDRDQDDCRCLKNQLDNFAHDQGLRTKNAVPSEEKFRIVNRIVVVELESWFLGDEQAVRYAYPKVPQRFSQRKKYRDPDSIKGSAWQALLKILQEGGYYTASKSLPKIDVARNISAFMKLDANSSRSFNVFLNNASAFVSQEKEEE